MQQALRVADELGERVYLPQLLLLEAAIAREKGLPVVARTAVRHAVEEARTQEAAWLELLALVELCACHYATIEELQALAELLERLPEVAGSRTAQRARALLQKVTPA